MLAAADDGGSCLQFVDPYGDTLFNQKQIPTLIVELMNLALDREDERYVAVAKDLVTFVTRFRDQPHTYVRFVGD
jgi:hypothetical protein